MQKLASEVEERSRQIAELRTKRAEKTAEASQRTKRMEALELRRTGLKERRDQEIRLRQTICEMSSGRTRLMEEKERLDAKLRSLGEVPFDDVQYQQVRKESTELKPKVDRAKQMMVQVERVPVLEEELGRVSETLSRAEKERQDIESSMTQLGYKEGDLKAAQSLLDQAMGAKEQKTATLTRHEREFAGLEKEVHLRQESLVELEAKEKEWGVASKRLQEQTVLSQVMKDFRKNLISRIVPTLSELSSRLFQDLTESKFGGLEIDEDYRIYIYDKGEKYPLSRFSGGESDLANLCLRLAISRVIAERAGSAVNFLILDEIFGSQDQARKRNILEAFNQLSKQFRQIFLITHIEDVKEFMGNAIMVLEAEDGSGRIEVSA
jgi:exonuclease SbcC